MKKKGEKKGKKKKKKKPLNFTISSPLASNRG